MLVRQLYPGLSLTMSPSIFLRLWPSLHGSILWDKKIVLRCCLSSSRNMKKKQVLKGSRLSRSSSSGPSSSSPLLQLPQELSQHMCNMMRKWACNCRQCSFGNAAHVAMLLCTFVHLFGAMPKSPFFFTCQSAIRRERHVMYVLRDRNHSIMAASFALLVALFCMFCTEPCVDYWTKCWTSKHLGL